MVGACGFRFLTQRAERGADLRVAEGAVPLSGWREHRQQPGVARRPHLVAMKGVGIAAGLDAPAGVTP